jgi:hypothetical protein
MTPLKKIESALAGITPYIPGAGEHMFVFENVSTGNHEPPAYMWHSYS